MVDQAVLSVALFGSPCPALCFGGRSASCRMVTTTLAVMVIVHAVLHAVPIPGAPNVETLHECLCLLLDLLLVVVSDGSSLYHPVHLYHLHGRASGTLVMSIWIVTPRCCARTPTTQKSLESRLSRRTTIPRREQVLGSVDMLVVPRLLRLLRLQLRLQVLLKVMRAQILGSVDMWTVLCLLLLLLQCLQLRPQFLAKEVECLLLRRLVALQLVSRELAKIPG